MEMNSWHAFPSTTTALPTIARFGEAQGRRAFVLIVYRESSVSYFGWKAERKKGTLFMKRQSYFVFGESLRIHMSFPGYSEVANGPGPRLSKQCLLSVLGRQWGLSGLEIRRCWCWQRCRGRRWIEALRAKCEDCTEDRGWCLSS